MATIRFNPLLVFLFHGLEFLCRVPPQRGKPSAESERPENDVPYSLKK